MDVRAADGISRYLRCLQGQMVRCGGFRFRIGKGIQLWTVSVAVILEMDLARANRVENSRICHFVLVSVVQAQWIS